MRFDNEKRATFQYNYGCVQTEYFQCYTLYFVRIYFVMEISLSVYDLTNKLPKIMYYTFHGFQV